MSCFACFSVSLQTQLYFWGRNMYMQQWTSSFKKYFSKNTFYLFFNSAKTNGFHFTSLLVTDIVNHDIRNLTNQKRKNSFIINDSLFNRTLYKKTKLEFKVFDHIRYVFQKDLLFFFSSFLLYYSNFSYCICTFYMIC